MPPIAPAVSQQTQRRFLLRLKTELTEATPFRATRLFCTLVAIGLVFQLMPRPNGWTLDHIHKEDGVIFLSDFAHLGWASFFEPYSGYLHLLPRLLTGVGTLLPIEFFGIWVGITTALVKAAVSLVMYPVMTRWLRSARWGAIAAAAPLISPLASQEVLGNYTNLRWYMALVVFFIAWAAQNGWRANVGLALFGLLAGFTEPLTVLVVPLLLARAWLNRGWGRAPAIIALSAIATHFVFFMTPSSRGDVLGVGYLLSHPANTFQGLMLRGPGASLFGSNLSKAAMQLVGSWFWLAGFAVVIVLALLTVVIVRRQRDSVPGLVFSWTLIIWGLVVLSATMSFSTLEALDMGLWYSVGQTSRYALSASEYILPGLIGIASLSVKLRPPMPWRIIGASLGASLLAVLPLATAADFPGDKMNYAGPSWTATVQESRRLCTAGAHEVVVPFTPQGTPVVWTSTLPCAVFLRA